MNYQGNYQLTQYLDSNMASNQGLLSNAQPLQTNYNQGLFSNIQPLQTDYNQGLYSNIQSLQNDYSQGQLSNIQLLQNDYSQGQLSNIQPLQTNYNQGLYSNIQPLQNNYNQGLLSNIQPLQNNYNQGLLSNNIQPLQNNYNQGLLSNNIQPLQNNYNQGLSSNNIQSLQTNYNQGLSYDGQSALSYDISSLNSQNNLLNNQAYSFPLQDQNYSYSNPYSTGNTYNSTNYLPTQNYYSSSSNITQNLNSAIPSSTLPAQISNLDYNTLTNKLGLGGYSGIDYLSGLSNQTAPIFNINSNQGNAYSGNTYAGNALTANTYTGNALPANTYTGNALTANTYTGNALTSNTYTGNALAGNTVIGNTLAGNIYSNNNNYTGNIYTGGAYSGTTQLPNLQTGYPSSIPQYLQTNIAPSYNPNLLNIQNQNTMIGNTNQYFQNSEMTSFSQPTVPLSVLAGSSLLPKVEPAYVIINGKKCIKEPGISDSDFYLKNLGVTGQLVNVGSSQLVSKNVISQNFDPKNQPISTMAQNNMQQPIMPSNLNLPSVTGGNIMMGNLLPTQSIDSNKNAKEPEVKLENPNSAKNTSNPEKSKSSKSKDDKDGFFD